MTSPLSLPVGNVAGLTELDLATGVLLGTRPLPPLPPAPRDMSLKQVMMDATESGMTDGPFFVAFSGGRDSAAALALTTVTARARGYPDPIPITLRYPGVQGEGDVERQELVVRHLGLSDWERVEVHDELQIVGPIATRVVRRLGVLWPANAFTLVPLLERARGGTLRIAGGSTDFFAFWRWAPLSDVLAGHRRPTRRDLGLLMATILPVRARAAIARRRGIPPPMPWLRRDAERRARELITGRSAKVPLRFDRAVHTQFTHRCSEGAIRSMQALADDVGTRIVQPYFNARCISAIAAAGGARGFGNKARCVEAVLGDLLPAEALQRGDSPVMSRVLFGHYTRDFAERWSGKGLDDSLVSPDALRAIWLGEEHDWRTSGLMQLAWLSDELAAETKDTQERRNGWDQTTTRHLPTSGRPSVTLEA
jgi:hypothetical protein